MHVAKLRQVGGSIMVAIPPALLEQLRMSANTSVSITIEEGRLVVEAKTRPRYTVAALLAECDAEASSPVGDEIWASGPAAGEELI